MNKILLIALLCVPLLSQAKEENLDQQLQNLTIPENEAPLPLEKENLYSVQNRFVPLAKNSQVLLGAGYNINSDSYLNSREFRLSYRYHFNDNWHLTASGSYVTNSMSSAGNTLIKTNNIVPDVAYARERADLLVGYNMLYGKFRVGMDKVLYFDQYLAIGPGLIRMNTGNAIGPVLDGGVVLWLGKSLNAQFGIRSFYHKEVRALSSSNVNDILLHLDMGWRFGGSNI